METTARASEARWFTSCRRTSQTGWMSGSMRNLTYRKRKMGQANHEGICACMCHIGVPAAATDLRAPRSRARSPRGRQPRHPPSPPHDTE
eukprot:724697-Pyramimonas_sp.AAC.1